MYDQLKIAIVGDLFPRPINYQLFADGKEETIFDRKICEIFQSCDYRVCNLEGCFTDEHSPKKLKYGPNIRAPKECISAFSGLGIDCVSLANNHITDFVR